VLNLELPLPRNQDGRCWRMRISNAPRVFTSPPFNPPLPFPSVRWLLHSKSTMPALLGWTLLHPRSCLQSHMLFYYPTTSGGPSETQHTFSSCSPCSAQVSCSTPLRTWRRSQEADRSLSVRVTAFVLRAVLAGSESAGENLGLVIGELVVYSVGFFGLLYSAYTLVLDR